MPAQRMLNVGQICQVSCVYSNVKSEILKAKPAIQKNPLPKPSKRNFIWSNKTQTGKNLSKHLKPVDTKVALPDNNKVPEICPSFLKQTLLSIPAATNNNNQHKHTPIDQPLRNEEDDLDFSLIEKPQQMQVKSSTILPDFLKQHCN